MAGGARQALFDNYLFMAPYTNRRAPTFRPDAGGWVSVGVPRVIALTLLNRIGITAFNHLPVLAFAINDAPRANEIMVAVAITDSGRPLPRVGGLTTAEIKGEDGLR